MGPEAWLRWAVLSQEEVSVLSLRLELSKALSSLQIPDSSTSQLRSQAYPEQSSMVIAPGSELQCPSWRPFSHGLPSPTWDASRENGYLQTN